MHHTLAAQQKAAADAAAAAAPPFPEGAPAKAWKVDELRAFAAAHEVDLGEAKTKDEILAALVPATPVTPVPDPATPAEPVSLEKATAAE